MVARELELTDSAVRSWVEAARKQSSPTATSQVGLEAENQELRQRIKVVEMERSILKKPASQRAAARRGRARGRASVSLGPRGLIGVAVEVTLEGLPSNPGRWGPRGHRSTRVFYPATMT